MSLHFKSKIRDVSHTKAGFCALCSQLCKAQALRRWFGQTLAAVRPFRFIHSAPRHIQPAS